MFKNDEELKNYLKFHTTESQNIEYKRGESWKSQKHNITRAALALSNTENGGYIIIGVSDPKNFHMDISGMTKDIADDYTIDIVSEFINKYADPNISIELKHFTIDDKHIVVIQVYEFESIPIICKKQYLDTLILGALYNRPLRKIESSSVSTTTDMRQVIEMSVKKNLKNYIKVIDEVSPNVFSDKFEKSIQDTQCKLNEKCKIISEKGYWEIIARPVKYPEIKLNTLDLKTILIESQYNNPEWPYPRLSSDLNDIRPMSNGVEYDLNYYSRKEFFQYYDSGLFVGYFGLLEDNQVPEKYDELHTMQIIGMLTMFYGFISKLPGYEIYDEKIYFEINLHNQKNRKLYFTNFNYGGYSDPLRDESITIPPLVKTKLDLEINSDELIIEHAMQIMEKFVIRDKDWKNYLISLQKNILE